MTPLMTPAAPHRTALLLILAASLLAAAGDAHPEPGAPAPPPASPAVGAPADPTALLDRAAALLASLRTRSSEYSVLFGVPDARQRALAAAAADEAISLVTRADKEAMERAERLQDELLGLPRDGRYAARASAIEDELARLLDRERAIRVPFLRARAEVVLAALNSADRAERLRFARESLSAIDLGRADSEADRRVSLAASLRLAQAGRLDRALADQAKSLLRTLLDQEPFRTGEPFSVQRLGARLGLIASGEPDPSAAEAPADPASRLLLAEAHVRALLEQPPSDPARIDAALRTILAIGDEPANSDLLSVIDDKVRASTDGVHALDALSPRVVLSRARSLWRSEREAGPDSPAAAGALDLFRAVAARPDAPSPLRASAMRDLGAALATSEDPRTLLAGAASLLESAALDQSAPASLAALLEAARLTGLLVALPTDAGDPARRRPEGALALHESVLRSLLARSDGDHIEWKWREDFARAVLHRWQRTCPPAVEPELNEALGALRAGTDGPADPSAANALSDQLVARALECAAGNMEAGAAVALAAVEDARAAGRPSLTARRLDAARALAARGDARAIDEFQSVIRDAESTPGADPVPAQLGLARALRTLGRTVEARTALVALVARLDSPTDASNSPGQGRRAEFWSAWAELAEVISTRPGAAATELDTLRLHLERLAALDPTLGETLDGAAAARLRKVRESVGGSTPR